MEPHPEIDVRLFGRRWRLLAAALSFPRLPLSHQDQPNPLRNQEVCMPKRDFTRLTQIASCAG